MNWVLEPDCLAIVVRDFFWETEEAGRSLLGFLAAQRAVGTNLYWTGPPNDPLLGFMPEHLPRTQSSYQWMNRVLHVPNALTARGYPAAVSGNVEFAIGDDVLPANSGGYRLTVSGGSAQIETVEDPRMTISTNGLAALFTGWWTSRQARSAGHITDATEGELDTIDALFSGSIPWLNEFF